MIDPKKLEEQLEDVLVEGTPDAERVPEFEEIPLEAYTEESGVQPSAHKPTQSAKASRTLVGVDFGEMRPHLKDGYSIKGLLTPNSLVGIIGQSGSGKTFFATDLAMHAAAGRR